MSFEILIQVNDAGTYEIDVIGDKNQEKFVLRMEAQLNGNGLRVRKDSGKLQRDILDNQALISISPFLNHHDINGKIIGSQSLLATINLHSMNVIISPPTKNRNFSEL